MNKDGSQSKSVLHSLYTNALKSEKVVYHGCASVELWVATWMRSVENEARKSILLSRRLYGTAAALSACTSVHRSMLRLLAMLTGCRVRSKEVGNCYLLGPMWFLHDPISGEPAVPSTSPTELLPTRFLPWRHLPNSESGPCVKSRA